MSALTQKEREGLEDVFMSIHTNQAKLNKLKEIASLLFTKSRRVRAAEPLFIFKKSNKNRSFSDILSYFQKTKKNLSK